FLSESRMPEIGPSGSMSGAWKRSVSHRATPRLYSSAEMEQMHAFAARWRQEHRGQWFTVGKLSGFCLLMTRVVYDAVGGLDEQFGIGFFDDDDLAERARRAGFQLAVAHDLFVHHFGSRTFMGNGIDAARLLDENQRKFAAKWGLSDTGWQRVALRRFEPLPQAETRDGNWAFTEGNRGNEGLDRGSAGRARVSLTMIVRNEEDNLSHALESVAGLFDEIVVVDTGSTDRTVEIARSFGAQVFDFVWVDDFAAARNAALARATG